VIGPAHLFLMLWLGGAVCFASFILLFARFAPDDFEETGMTLPMIVVATMVWPYALLRAFQMIQQEAQWKERRRVRFPQPNPAHNGVLASDFPPSTPELCARCQAEHENVNRQVNELIKSLPPPCDDCTKKFSDWVKER